MRGRGYKRKVLCSIRPPPSLLSTTSTQCSRSSSLSLCDLVLSSLSLRGSFNGLGTLERSLEFRFSAGFLCGTTVRDNDVTRTLESGTPSLFGNVRTNVKKQRSDPAERQF
jgi:hypothetical protein